MTEKDKQANEPKVPDGPTRSPSASRQTIEANDSPDVPAKSAMSPPPTKKRKPGRPSYEQMGQAIEDLRQDVARLRAALRPFAEIPGDIQVDPTSALYILSRHGKSVSVTHRDIENARIALGLSS